MVKIRGLTGRWQTDELTRLYDGLELHGKDLTKLAIHVETRDRFQIREKLKALKKQFKSNESLEGAHLLPILEKTCHGNSKRQKESSVLLTQEMMIDDATSFSCGQDLKEASEDSNAGNERESQIKAALSEHESAEGRPSELAKYQMVVGNALSPYHESNSGGGGGGCSNGDLAYDECSAICSFKSASSCQDKN